MDYLRDYFWVICCLFALFVNYLSFVRYLLPKNPNNASNQEEKLRGKVQIFGNEADIICGLFVYYCRLFVHICILFVVINGTHCMRTHQNLSSQRGASAEFQLRVEASQHVGVGPPLRVQPHCFSLHLCIRQAQWTCEYFAGVERYTRNETDLPLVGSCYAEHPMQRSEPGRDPCLCT